ncbi:SCO family protein [Ramlibacter sp. RBP-2]|uniref:SCO family protein n=1 Tax=Ramlibacter lithotrophicus TaxID=2606681 RepID=A0A7X6I828_9BURK|nr:SCO family protein [Ramlibacter lithotrophicus]NKE67930.1 SCO family protein [Ramlibacter lithotrophicus]
MLRTALLCTALAIGGYASAAWLTHDFQAWTAEGARRLEVALSPVATPPVLVEGPATPARSLAQVVGDGQSVTIVDFIYTRCETVCLSLGSTFQQMQAALQADPGANVRLLSVSFDPRDSSADLQAYAGRMRADAKHWRFVRGVDERQTRALLSAFQVVVVPDGRGDFEHNAALLVVDPRGRLVRVFDIAEQELALNYARHLAAQGSS